MSRPHRLACAIREISGIEPFDEPSPTEVEWACSFLGVLARRDLAVVTDGEARLAGHVWLVQPHRIGIWDIPIPDLLRVVGPSAADSDAGLYPPVTDSEQTRVILLHFLANVHHPGLAAYPADLASLVEAAQEALARIAPPASPPAIRPGDVIRQYMSVHSLTPARFAAACGWNDDGTFVDRLISGEQPITHEVAANLAYGTGIPSFLWTQLQTMHEARR